MVSSSSSSQQACAACKFQRRKCTPDCPLAPYFPAEANERFISCKKLFGVSNLVRYLKDANIADREATMKSLIYEAEARDKDPVYGAVGIINSLSDENTHLRQELQMLRSQLQAAQQHLFNFGQASSSMSLLSQLAYSVGLDAAQGGGSYELLSQIDDNKQQGSAEIH